VSWQWGGNAHNIFLTIRKLSENFLASCPKIVAQKCNICGQKPRIGKIQGRH